MKDGKNYPWEVSAQILGETLGISARRVQQLREIGIFENTRRGRYDLRICVQAYVSYKESLTKDDDDKRDDLYDEKVLLTRAKRQLEEKKLQIIQGRLHRSETVQSIMSNMLMNFKAKLLSMPTMLAPKLLAQTQLPVIQDTLLEGVNAALTELSEYDPDMFYSAADDEIVPDDDEDEEAGDGHGDS